MRQLAVNNGGAGGRHRGAALVAALAVGALAVGGCAGAKTSSGSTSSRLTVGISLSLTGGFADPGRAAKRGYDLWADTVNANDGVLGRKIQLKVLDDGSEPERAVANYETLIGTEHVDLVLGPFSSKLTIPSSQVAAKHGYAFIEPAGGSPKVFEQQLNNLFFVQPAPVDQQGAVFANYILSLPAESRPKTAAYPALDDPFAQPIADRVRELFEAAGIKTVYSRTYAEGADLKPVVAEMAAANPEVVVAATQSVDGYALVGDLVQLRWAPRWLYVANGANSPVEFPAKVGKENVNGIFSSGDWFPGSNASGSAVFVGAYLKKYGGSVADIDNTSVEAYSAGSLIEQVATKTGKIDNATIIETLHAGTWPTPVGDLSWDARGAPVGSYMLFQWIDGKLQSIYPPGRAQHAPDSAPLPWVKSTP
ncbi:MAG: branched-chain amino acid transport system substrate-binding protein [Micromonosporaceae bacterium]|jgi:branched-chain amino acid transport system substrate-binding protein|nr:branched-chain amino acid transport system substrate-binding protein [Micromonosporaceae bacterium]